MTFPTNSAFDSERIKLPDDLLSVRHQAEPIASIPRDLVTIPIREYEDILDEARSLRDASHNRYMAAERQIFQERLDDLINRLGSYFGG